MQGVGGTFALQTGCSHIEYREVLRKCCLEQRDVVNVYYLRYKITVKFIFCSELNHAILS